MIFNQHSDITITQHKDGQVSVKCNDYPLALTWRINSNDDLIALLCVLEAYQHNNKKVKLTVPCMFGQRSDRRFKHNESFDLKVICNCINQYSSVIDKIYVMKPHSDVVESLLDTCCPYTLDRLIEDSYYMIQGKSEIFRDNFCLVSPDGGAYKWVSKIADKINFDIVAANKCRVNGNPEITFVGDVKDRHCLIVDDYCDGGRTFINLAQKLKEQGAKQVDLFVYHGLFSYGIDVIIEGGINHIYCTNSIQDVQHDKVTCFST